MGVAPILRVYIAGPDVFLGDAVALAGGKKALCARLGVVGLHPFDNEAGDNQLGDNEAGDNGGALPCPGGGARGIYLANRAMMVSADAVIANLTPFRGASADAGTVFEVGYMAGLGRPVFGYSLEPRLYRERVVADGAAVEDFGLHDNLMIDCGLAGYVVAGAAAGLDEVGRHLWCFERCLEALAGHFERCRLDLRAGEGGSFGIA